MASVFTFNLIDQAVPVNATDTLANSKSIFELAAPAGQAIRITSLDVTFDALPQANNKPVLINLIRATATGTFPTTNATAIDCLNADLASDTSAVAVGGIKYGTATVEGTVASVAGWRSYRLPSVGGVIYQLPLGREIWIPKGQFFRIRAVATVAVNLSLNLDWEQ